MRLSARSPQVASKKGKEVCAIDRSHLGAYRHRDGFRQFTEFSSTALNEQLVALSDLIAARLAALRASRRCCKHGRLIDHVAHELIALRHKSAVALRRRLASVD